MDGLFAKLKKVWGKYFDIDDESITLCSADTIFTYFQDKMGMTHYLLFVGDNNTGKSNALRIFYQLGYRPLFDTSITPANIYNFLGQFEEGQGIILEDELDNIEENEEKMKIYKTGYVSGSIVFSKTTLQKLKGNYSLVNWIEILDRSNSTNTSNTFNTFWKCTEGNGVRNGSLKSCRLTNSEQKSKEYEGKRRDSDESNNISVTDNIENEGARPTKALEVLEVLGHEKITEVKIREKQLYRKWRGSDTWACPNCNETGDKWHMLEHLCKRNKK